MYTEKDARKIWGLMIRRCSEGYAKVCDEWKNYSNFKEWYMNNVYGTKQFRLELDKDLFSKGDKVYSPETCCLIPKSINLLIASCTSRNNLLPGVTYNPKSETFTASINFATKINKKTFKTEDEAFQFYKTEKEKVIKTYTEAYSFLLPDRIYKTLMSYTVKPIRGKWMSGYQRKFETY